MLQNTIHCTQYFSTFSTDFLHISLVENFFHTWQSVMRRITRLDHLSCGQTSPHDQSFSTGTTCDKYIKVCLQNAFLAWVCMWAFFVVRNIRFWRKMLPEFFFLKICFCKTHFWKMHFKTSQGCEECENLLFLKCTLVRSCPLITLTKYIKGHKALLD